MKTLKLLPLIVILAACGARVEVPPAHIGKIKTSAGIEEGVKQPSTFRLPASVFNKNQIILVEVSHFNVEEQMTLFMPEDKLNLTFDIRATLAVDETKTDMLFDKVPASETDNDRVLLISALKVYKTYVEQIVRNEARAIMSEFSIAEIMSNRNAVNAKLVEGLSASMSSKNYPIKIIEIGLADIQPPEVIVKAEALAKEREIAIKKAEADKAVAIAEAEAQLEVARKVQEAELVEAETQVLVETKISESVSKAYVTQRALKVLEQFAQSDNKVVILPMDVFQSPELLTGLSMDVFNQTAKVSTPEPDVQQ